MAAAARPNPADARVPCPLCGGLIHPIAGRCKHCKGDLSAMRSTRPAAAATLPSLHANGNVQVVTPVAAPSPYANGHANGHAANGHASGGVASNGHIKGHYHPPVPIGVPPPAMPDPNAMQPILPPRPTGRMPTATAASASWWKSWPLIVIVLAGLAIVAAVVLMVLP